MSKKRYRPEEIIAKLREAEVLLAQGMKIPEVAKSIGIHEITCYRWRKEYGGMKVSQAKRLKELEKENTRLRKAVSDLSLDKVILQEAARGNFQALSVAGPACVWCVSVMEYLSAEHAVCWASIDPRNGILQSRNSTKTS